jgi:hypothetical protein
MKSETDSTILPGLYEEVRGWVLDPLTEPWKASRRFGWGVLLHRGMSAWMESCSKLPSSTQDAAATDPGVLAPVPSSTHVELAGMLSSILINQAGGWI